MVSSKARAGWWVARARWQRALAGKLACTRASRLKGLARVALARAWCHGFLPPSLSSPRLSLLRPPPRESLLPRGVDAPLEPNPWGPTRPTLPTLRAGPWRPAAPASTLHSRHNQQRMGGLGGVIERATCTNVARPPVPPPPPPPPPPAGPLVAAPPSRLRAHSPKLSGAATRSASPTPGPSRPARLTSGPGPGQRAKLLPSATATGAGAAGRVSARAGAAGKAGGGSMGEGGGDVRSGWAGSGSGVSSIWRKRPSTCPQRTPVGRITRRRTNRSRATEWENHKAPQRDREGGRG